MYKSYSELRVRPIITCSASAGQQMLRIVVVVVVVLVVVVGTKLNYLRC